jgi:hypothetical protein
VRVGEYEIVNEGVRAWWNGEEWSQWYLPDHTPVSKEFHKKLASPIQKLNWRGLSKG